MAYGYIQINQIFRINALLRKNWLIINMILPFLPDKLKYLLYLSCNYSSRLYTIFDISYFTERLACPYGKIGLSIQPFLPGKTPFIPHNTTNSSAQYVIKPRIFKDFMPLNKTNIFICCCNLIFIYYLHGV